MLGKFPWLSIVYIILYISTIGANNWLSRGSSTLNSSGRSRPVKLLINAIAWPPLPIAFFAYGESRTAQSSQLVSEVNSLWEEEEEEEEDDEEEEEEDDEEEDMRSVVIW